MGETIINVHVHELQMDLESLVVAQYLLPQTLEVFLLPNVLDGVISLLPRHAPVVYEMGEIR